jgi:hypothetical protein
MNGRRVGSGWGMVGGGRVALAILVATTEWQCAEAAGPRVQILVGEAAPALERRAAEDVAANLQRIYEADTQVVTVAADAAHVILIGRPETNPHVKPFASLWSEKKLTDQGHLVHTVDFRGQPALLLGGGSPAATYWAASEYAHALGVRSLLYGDLYPIAPPPFTLAGFDLALEPKLRVRGWQLLGDSPLDSSSWSLAEHQRFLRQLAKLKFNRVVLEIHPWQPFVQVKFGEIRNDGAVLWSGPDLSVTGDAAGRAAFGGAKLFQNPDIAGVSAKVSAADRFAAGRKFFHGLIAAAHECGLTVGARTEPFLISDWQPQSNDFSTRLAAGDDEARFGWAVAQSQALIATYPELDAVYLVASSTGDWDGQAAALWPRLGEKLRSLPLDDSRHREFILTQKSPALFPRILEQTVANTSLHHAWNVPETSKALSDGKPLESPASGRTRTLEMPLVSGFLPQTTVIPLTGLSGLLSISGWSGVVLHGDGVGDLDVAAYAASRADWGTDFTAASPLTVLLNPVCGEGVDECLRKALALIEKATLLIAQNEPSFATNPDLLRFYRAEEAAPKWQAEVQDCYLNAMNEMYRANTRAREGGRSFTLYLARRYEFAYGYLACVDAIRQAGAAARMGDRTKQIAQLEAAIEALHAGLNSLAAVGRSNSDRGIIAVLNETGYRPLLKLLEEADAAQ